MAVARHHYIVGLEIAMDDARGMCFCESVSNVLQVAQKLREISVLVMNELTQRQAINEFHGDEVQAISFTNFVDVRDVRMVQRGGSLRLLSETPHSIFIRRDFEWQNFQGDGPSQLHIFGQIHLAHPAFANLRADFVTAEFYARSKRHVWLTLTVRNCLLQSHRETT